MDNGQTTICLEFVHNKVVTTLVIRAVGQIIIIIVYQAAMEILLVKHIP
jgi:hypothetical protein